MKTTRFAAACVAAAFALHALAPLGAQQKPRFYDDDPLWIEPVHDVPGDITRYEPDLFFDTLLNQFANPGDKTLNVRAKNTNSIDEVMNGPWFTNRAGMTTLTAEQVARASNTGDGPAPGKWTVVSAKSDGVTPGFTIRDSKDDLWFIKFDPPGYRGMATGTEVAASKLFWAVGYHTVEHYISRLRPDDLAIGESTTFARPGAKERRMRRDDISWLLRRAVQETDGSYRVIATKAAPGRPVGRIEFFGTRPDDPNDLVPHEHRRELRGYRVFAAWLNHVDAKSINSLDALVRDGGKQYVRHFLLDFSSTMGSGSVHPRDYFEGYEPVIEPYGEIGKRMASLGFAIPRWRTIDFVEYPSIGRVPVDHSDWDPDTWTPRFPNSAFTRARADDKFWATRKLQGITNEMIAAALREGRFEDEKGVAALQTFLQDRRDAIVRRYLPAVNPVVNPALDPAGNLSFENAAVQAKVAPAAGEYLVTWARFDNATGTVTEIGQTKGGERQAPPPAGLPTGSGAMVRVAIAAGAGGQPSWSKPVHAYFRITGGAWKLVGFERMPE